MRMSAGLQDPLIVWLGVDQTENDYLGLGLDNGLVKVRLVVFDMSVLGLELLLL